MNYRRQISSSRSSLISGGRWSWTAITVDGSFSVYFEHTVAITKDGPAILTR